MLTDRMPFCNKLNNLENQLTGYETIMMCYHESRVAMTEIESSKLTISICDVIKQNERVVGSDMLLVSVVLFG